MNPKQLLTGCILICSPVCFTQEVVTTSGAYFETAELSISWTVGELMTATCESTEVDLTQGEQQSAFDYAGIRNLNPITGVFVHPNPFIDVLTINSNGQDYQFAVHAATGELVQEGNLSPTATQVNLNEIASGVYYLKIYSDTNQKSFKLIKH